MKNDRNGSISFSNSRKWLHDELKKPRAKRLIRAYVAQMVSGNIDFKILGNIYRPKEAIPEASVKRLLKYKETQIKVNEALEQILNDNNITIDAVIKERKAILDDAKSANKEDLRTKDSLEIRLEVVKGFELMHNMTAQKSVTKQLTQETSFTKLLETGEKQQVTSKQTLEIPSNNDKIEESGDND